jgi:hypothetical protein
MKVARIKQRHAKAYMQNITVRSLLNQTLIGCKALSTTSMCTQAASLHSIGLASSKTHSHGQCNLDDAKGRYMHVLPHMQLCTGACVRVRVYAKECARACTDLPTNAHMHPSMHAFQNICGVSSRRAVRVLSLTKQAGCRISPTCTRPPAPCAPCSAAPPAFQAS